MPISQTKSSMTTISGRSESDLTELLRAVARGERAALAEVYAQVEGSIRAFALSRLGDAEAAADVLQDVMLTVWRQAGSFRGGSRPRTWILGITHHKIVDRLRHRGRWTPQSPAPGTPGPGAPGPGAPGPGSPAREVSDPTALSPLEAIEGEERQATVRRALATLSENHRQVLHLVFYEDLGYAEIAGVLGIAQGTVKTRVFHAKKILARRLGPLYGGDRR